MIKMEEQKEESDKLMMQIVKLVLQSKLSYWESIGLLEHTKMEIHRIVDEEVDYKKDG